MKCLCIISLILLTSCAYKPGKETCPTSPEYKEYYGICLQNIKNDLAFMVKVCDEVAYSRTKFCY